MLLVKILQQEVTKIAKKEEAKSDLNQEKTTPILHRNRLLKKEDELTMKTNQKVGRKVASVLFSLI